MSRKQVIYIITLLSIIPFQALSQYTLNLQEAEWNFNSKIFYISQIVDERSGKSDAGKVLIGDKPGKAVFRTSLETDLMKVISNVTLPDSNKVPLILAIEKFSLNETGSSRKHTLTLDFAVRIFRKIDEKQYDVFSAKGKPEITMTGTHSGMTEKIVSDAITKMIEGFSEWINENPNNPALAKSVVIQFADSKFKDGRSDTISWSSDYKLQWSDFRGKPSSSPFMALSNCMFNYYANPEVRNGMLMLNLNIQACFERSTSWVKPGQTKDRLLAHEQLHFDICELNIRKLKAQIQQLKLNPMEFDSQIRIVFNDVWNAYQQQQSAYDSETEHGIQEEKQIEWEKEIARLLR